MPVYVTRGTWDGLALDTNARASSLALTGSPDQSDLKIGRGTHLMHFEARHGALRQASVTFKREVALA